MTQQITAAPAGPGRAGPGSHASPGPLVDRDSRHWLGPGPGPCQSREGDADQLEYGTRMGLRLARAGLSIVCGGVLTRRGGGAQNGLSRHVPRPEVTVGRAYPGLQALAGRVWRIAPAVGQGGA